MVTRSKNVYTIDKYHKVTVTEKPGQIDITDEDKNKIIVQKRKGKLLLKLKGNFEFKQ